MPELKRLPPEILNIVFEYVQPKKLLDLRLCCRWLNGLIQSSSVAQYRIECWSAGVIDDRIDGLPYSERLSVLRQREIRWRRGEWLKEVNIDVPSTSGASGVYDLDGGRIFLGREPSGFSSVNLPSPYTASSSEPEQWRHYDLEGHLVDFGLAVEDDDLIAVVTSKPLETPARVGLLGACSFDLHLISLSTGHAHPSCTKSVIQLLCTAHWVIRQASAAIQVIGDYVVVLMHNVFAMGEDGINDKIYIVNWKTGTSRLVSSHKVDTYQGMIMLSEDLILLPNVRLASLDVFKLQIDEQGVPSLVPYAYLELPALRATRLMVGCQCVALPTISAQHGHRSSPNTRACTFRDSPEDAIAVFTFQFNNNNATLIVHRKTLLAAAKAAAALDRPVPYARWGADKCSWKTGAGNWITQCSGQRLCTSTERLAKNIVSIRDYNPYNVRRASRQADVASEEDEEDTVSVSSAIVTKIVQDEDCVLPEVFEEPLGCGIPYVETSFVVHNKMGIDDFLLDSERLIGIKKKNPASYTITKLHIKVFG